VTAELDIQKRNGRSY